MCQLAVQLDFGVVGTTSCNGIAAVDVDNSSSTVCLMFHIFDTADGSDSLTLDPEAIKVLADKINAKNVCFLIIDEVSTVDTCISAMLDMWLQQILANTLPFGGQTLSPCCEALNSRSKVSIAPITLETALLGSIPSSSLTPSSPNVLKVLFQSDCPKGYPVSQMTHHGILVRPLSSS